ncbi:MAG TPA: protein-glutamate O-methyltransferase CheR [Chthonomonadaceae bacterium]|nr:protein-glutamate O-methyltransferase CheR [Chthonomonadaceae bacterium]
MSQSMQAKENENGGTADFVQFKARFFQKSGVDLNLYKQQQMHRRLLSMVERAQQRTFMDYFQVLERDPQEYADFLDRLTINVSELFRNPEKWQELREKILPPRLEQRRGLKVWSAGCSYGAEPYSLAILLDQIAPGRDHTIHASDLDKAILAKAKEGRFTDADVRNLDAAVKTRYFTRLSAADAANALPDFSPNWQVKPEIRARVAFRSHNLLADRFETSYYDLICCRNVVIYFTDDAKDALFRRFREALAPGGTLFVGGTERIFNYREIGLDTQVPFFYHRVGN